MIKSLNIPKNVNTNLSIDNFIIIEIVGINNWGEIHKICEIETDQKFYSNNINKNIIIDTNIFIEQLQNQLNISDNPYIHKIEGIIENNDYIYILYEHHDLHLKEIIKEWHKIDLQVKIGIFSNIVHSINVCHNNNITHMNIMLDSIYIDSQGTACLSDFSLSCYNLSQNTLKQNISIDCYALGRLFQILFSNLDENAIHISFQELYNIEQGLLVNEPNNRWDTNILLNYLAMIGY
jgi:serine/threonine protein kinase